MAATNATVDEPQEEVRAWLATLSVGTLHPLSVRTERGEDSAGDEAWYFRVELPNPTGSEGTWPARDMLEMQRQVRDRALEAGLTWPWYVIFAPETEEEPEEPPAH